MCGIARIKPSRKSARKRRPMDAYFEFIGSFLVFMTFICMAGFVTGELRDLAVHQFHLDLVRPLSFGGDKLVDQAVAHAHGISVFLARTRKKRHYSVRQSRIDVELRFPKI